MAKQIELVKGGGGENTEKCSTGYKTWKLNESARGQKIVCYCRRCKDNESTRVLYTMRDSETKDDYYAVSYGDRPDHSSVVIKRSGQSTNSIWQLFYAGACCDEHAERLQLSPLSLTSARNSVSSSHLRNSPIPFPSICILDLLMSF